MVFKFLLLSDEVDNFSRVIAIDSEATFFDFHKAILDSVGYSDKEMTSFFVCSEGWEKGQEITLMPMDTASDQDNFVMDSTRLEEFVEDEGQRLLYVFDIMTERSFFIELRTIDELESLDAPEVLKSKGDAPAQLVNFEEFDTKSALSLDENFYGDEEYNLDELDAEGFDFGDSGSFAASVDNELY